MTALPHFPRLASPRIGFALPLSRDLPGTRESRISPALMRAIRPRSSVIDRVVYDEEAHTLAVTFRNTRRYIYSDVPRTIYDGFRHAASTGHFFNEAVKGRFPCRADRRRYPLA